MILTSIEAYIDLVLIKDYTFFSLWGIYFCKLLAVNGINLIIERKSDQIAMLMFKFLLKCEQEKKITMLYRFINKFRTEIFGVATESKY